MRTIKCILPPWEEPSFGTAQEAISYRASRNTHFQKESESLRGATIIGGSWTDSSFELLMSEGKALRLSISRNKVIWSIGGHPDPATICPPSSLDPVILQVSSEKNPEPEEVLWNRRAMFESRLGKKFKKAIAGESNIWLYTEETSSLLDFCRLINVDGDEEILYWYEEA
jgi:hypothetical protein